MTSAHDPAAAQVAEGAPEVRVDSAAGPPAQVAEEAPEVRVDGAVGPTALALPESFGMRLRRLYEVADTGPAHPSRLVTMEGMRGLAVLLVFFVHFNALFQKFMQPGAPLTTAYGFMGLVGNAGVDLFFVLSGYLIYGALVRRKVDIVDFLRRRVERIYPVFLFVFAIYLVLSVAFPAESKIKGPFLAGALYVGENLLLLPGVFPIPPIITVAWSLSYEFSFYLIAPLLIGLTGMRGWQRPTRMLFFCAFGLAYMGAYLMGVGLDLRMVMFLPGILLYETVTSGALKGRLGPVGSVVSGLVFAGSLAFTYFMKQTLLEGQRSGASDPMAQVAMSAPSPFRVAALGVGCFLLGLYCFQTNGPVSRLFTWRPLRALGNMSYSYYLIHGLTLKTASLVASKLIGPRQPTIVVLAMTLVGFVLTLVTSSLLFAAVEKPISLERRSLASYAGMLRSAFGLRA